MSQQINPPSPQPITSPFPSSSAWHSSTRAWHVAEGTKKARRLRTALRAGVPPLPFHDAWHMPACLQKEKRPPKSQRTLVRHWQPRCPSPSTGGWAGGFASYPFARQLAWRVRHRIVAEIVCPLQMCRLSKPYTGLTFPTLPDGQPPVKATGCFSRHVPRVLLAVLQPRTRQVMISIPRCWNPAFAPHSQRHPETRAPPVPDGAFLPSTSRPLSAIFA